MATAQVRLAPDLRRALDKLPKPDGIPEIHVSIDVAADGAPSAHAAKKTVATTVDFHRGVLTTAEGSVPVWVYEGTLTLDDDTAPADHAPAKVAAWLREQLGPRCVAVDVGEVDEHEARVRVAATLGNAHKPD